MPSTRRYKPGSILAMMLPPDHPQRLELANEVHARPPEELRAPLTLTYLALVVEPSRREEEVSRIAELAASSSAPAPSPDASHYSADLGAFRLKWERHAEFSRYKIIAPMAEGEPFAVRAIIRAPADWLAAMPGEVMVAADVALLRADDMPKTSEAISKAWFAGNAIVGSTLAGGAAAAFTDFHIHQGGFSRLVIEDRATTARQAGRLVQRLLEIDTYRIMAMMTLPIARRMTPVLNEHERELALITEAMVAVEDEDEPKLLDRLTRLQAEIESDGADNQFRFGAARAYYDIVQRRIADLREERIQGLPTFQEFIERRLAPAMNTCAAVSARQESLSRHMARATQLLSTRVNIANGHQSQAILESMNRRARLQMRLQETVEGLSIAAITYYIVGLVSYLAKGLKSGGVPVDADLVAAFSIPVVAVIVALGVRKVRKMVARGVV